MRQFKDEAQHGIVFEIIDKIRSVRTYNRLKYYIYKRCCMDTEYIYKIYKKEHSKFDFIESINEKRWQLYNIYNVNLTLHISLYITDLSGVLF